MKLRVVLSAKSAAHGGIDLLKKVGHKVVDHL